MSSFGDSSTCVFARTELEKANTAALDHKPLVTLPHKRVYATNQESTTDMLAMLLSAGVASAVSLQNSSKGESVRNNTRMDVLCSPWATHQVESLQKDGTRIKLLLSRFRSSLPV